jgi:outer membrane protein OmpA-like peptidoglycan-associated protein
MKQPTIKLLLLLLVCMLTVGGMGAKKATKTTTKPKTNTSATKGVIAPQKQKKVAEPDTIPFLTKAKIAYLNLKNATRPETNALLIKAGIAYQDMKFVIAADYYEAYLKNPAHSPTKALAELASCYCQMRDFNNALRVYKLLYPNGNASATVQDQIRIAELYARMSQYQQAAEWLNGVPGYELKAKAYKEVETLNAMKVDSLEWKIKFSNINTAYREFSPFYYNKTLLFSSNQPIENNKMAYSWDGDNYTRLWEIPIEKNRNTSDEEKKDSTSIKKTSYKKKQQKLADIYECGDSRPNNSVMGLFIKKMHLNGKLNSKATLVKGFDNSQFNIAAIALDKNKHIYFSSNFTTTDQKEVNRICIMEGIYSPKGVTATKPLPFCNADSFSVMHPAVNAEGTILVCSSDKIGGIGAFDLYYSQRKNKTKNWGKLRSLGNTINTTGNEVFPNISSNGYLYFSSDAMPGLGGLDIFRIPLIDAIDGTGIVEHIGYPLNSSADDFGWTQKDSTGASGFFTSDRLNNNDNIYSFDYEQSKESIKEMRKVKIGYIWKLSNVHYDFDKSVLRTDAKPILDSLVNISRDHLITLDSLMTVLNENPITIEISSHTDSRGSYKYNLELAQRRAESVVEYLVQHGIDHKRLSAKSYGKENLLKEDEKTDEDYQINRRSEVKVVGMGNNKE